MTTASSDFQDVVTRVRKWPPEIRRALAEELLRSLQPVVGAGAARGVPAEQVRGLAAGKGSPPDDETVRRWVEEYRWGKHG